MPDPTLQQTPTGTIVEARATADGSGLGFAEVILDAVIDAIVVFDPATRTIGGANAAAGALLGRTRADLLDHRIDEFLSASDVSRMIAVIKQLTAGRVETSTMRAQYAAAGGGSIAVEIVLRAVDLPGGTTGIVAVARDIRDRIDVQVRLQRLAEAEHARAAELNAVIRAMGEAVVVCQADGTISLSNPAGEMLFPDVEERTYADVLAELRDPDGVAPALGVAAGPVELRTVREPERWIEITTYPVHVGLGLASVGEETIVVMRDVTEARRREAIRETFIGVLSHELRTPVTTIFGGAKLLARERTTIDEETRRGIFHDIHDEAERLQRLVEDVVALNRFGEGPGEVGWEPVLLQRLVPGVVHSEEGRWPGVTFVLEISPGLPTVSADPTYVEQVLRNLASNGAKYGGPGSTVQVKIDAADGDVRVRVLDDGPGFPADEADRLFELFYRSPGTATTASGAGIGLFVCARLIAAMGGRIWAAPREGGGAEFGFTLPALDE